MPIKDTDNRDLETTLRQGLGLLEWQIRYLVLFINARHTPNAKVEQEILKTKITTIDACIMTLNFEGIKLTEAQEESLREYQRQLKTQYEENSDE